MVVAKTRRSASEASGQEGERAPPRQMHGIRLFERLILSTRRSIGDSASDLQVIGRSKIEWAHRSQLGRNPHRRSSKFAHPSPHHHARWSSNQP